MLKNSFKDKNLIIIASQPRSGSTYLQNLLSNNSQTNTVSEPWIMLALAPLFKEKLVVKATYDHRLAMDAFRNYQQKVDVNFYDEVKSLAIKMYEPLFDDYDFVIDKTPRYWEILDSLATIFPESKIIVLKRNPLDVVESMIQTWNITTIEGLNYFRNDILNAPKQIDMFIEKNHNNQNVIPLFYDDLINNKKETIESIYKRLGINFTNQVFDTSSNMKFKGKYGDPYQNKTKKEIKPLDNLFLDFINGYANYLGKDYLINNDFNYTAIKPTLAFKYFLNLGFHRNTVDEKSMKRELSLNLKKFVLKYFK